MSGPRNIKPVLSSIPPFTRRFAIQSKNEKKINEGYTDHSKDNETNRKMYFIQFYMNLCQQEQ